MSDEALYAVELVRTVPARRRRRIAKRLAAQLGADPARVRALLGRPPGPITKPIRDVDAAQIHSYFVQEGVMVELTEVTPEQTPDVLKTSTNLKLTSVVHRGTGSGVAPPSGGAWPESGSWTEHSDWTDSAPVESERNSAVRLIARVPPQRIEGLVKRLAHRLQVEPQRLRRLLSRPPGLLSKPINRSTSERITSILSAEGVAVESVQLLDAAESGPGSPDFDLRLTLDMARMRAQFGDSSPVVTSSDGTLSGSGVHQRTGFESPDSLPVVVETTPPQAVAVETPPPSPTRRRSRPTTEPALPAVTESESAPPQPAASDDASAGDVMQVATPEPATPSEPKQPGRTKRKRSASTPTEEGPPPVPDAVPDPVPDIASGRASDRVSDRPGERSGQGGSPTVRRSYMPKREPLVEDDEELEFPVLPNTAPASGSATASDVGQESSLSTGARPAAVPPPLFEDDELEIPPAPPRSAPSAETSSGVTPVARLPDSATPPSELPLDRVDRSEPVPATTHERPDLGRRGLYTLLAFDIGLLAILGSAGPVLSTPVGVTVLLLFSLLLLGQAMLTRVERQLSNLFASLAVAPMFFMFTALVETLSPWRELTADLQIVVISLLLLLSTLFLADTLGFGRYQLGLALWHRGDAGGRRAVHLLRRFGTFIGGLLLLLALGAVGLFVGVAAKRFLPATPDALGLAGTAPLLALVALLTAALAQELFFRGLLQQVGVRALGVPLGIALSALLFVFLYGGGPLGGNLLLALVLALAAGLVSHLTGSVLGLGLMNGLALAVYLGLIGDPMACLQGGVDLTCLVPGWPDATTGFGGLP